jgi:phospholipid/cholesterol/gamma-HCH transport system substrate-binding protein
MTRNWVESIVGAVVLAVAVWFLAYSYQSASTSGSGGSYELVGRFSGVDGVPVGADVRISGIKVGQVADMSLNQQTYQAEVRLSISNNTAIPVDSTLAVKSESLLGGRYLAIAPGADDLMLKDGEAFEFTQSALVLEDLIGQLIFSKDDK